MEELTFFNYDKVPLKIDKPIRLIELFAGIGSQAKALERLGADFEHYRVCEFDKYAIKSYNAIHNTDFVTSDITQLTADDLGIVDTDKYCYIMTYSFPCQDLSLAGKQKGMAKGENTRSGLLWEVERLLNECTELPQVLLMENVTQVHGKKNLEHFQEWINFLESKGYQNYWKDLNAKNFGIPQNRNRTFMVSVLGDYTYEFPEEFPLELRLKDMLEDSVDEKYYLSDKAIQGIQNSTYERKQHIVQEKDWCDTILARDYKDPKCVMVGMLSGGKWDKLHDISRRVYSGDGVAPTIHTSGGGQQEPKVLEPTINVVGNYSPSGHDASRIVDTEGIAPTVKENHGTVTAITEPLAYDEQNGYIRTDGTVGTLTTDSSSPKHNNRVIEPQIIKVGQASSVGSQCGMVYSPEGVFPTLCAGCHGYAMGYVDEEPQVKVWGKINSSQDGVIVDSNGISPTHTAGHGNTPKVTEGIKIRKLTPKECWRLMGFDDADFEKAAQYNSNSQLYKQAGNSIVVDVLYYIFKQML